IGRRVKCGAKLTLVCCGQYLWGRKLTDSSVSHIQVPTTGLEVLTWIAFSTAALRVTGELNRIVIGMPTPYVWWRPTIVLAENVVPAARVRNELVVAVALLSALIAVTATL